MVEAGGGGGGGDGVEEEGAGDLLWWEAVGEAGHPEFQVWREEEEGELRRVLWTEEGEEGLHDPLWMVEEGGVEPSYGVVEEEEGARHERGVEGVLQRWGKGQGIGDQVVSMHLKMTSHR